MHRFAEQGGVVDAVVEADHLQAREVLALEQVERGRRLAEAPQVRQRQAEDPARSNSHSAQSVPYSK